MIHLRVASTSDAEAILAVYAPYVRETAITFEYEVPSLAEMEERIRSTLQGYPYLVCQVDGKLAGYAYAHRYKERAAYQWNVELSVYLSQHNTGKGMGGALYRALIELCRMQRAQNAYAGVTMPNEKSQRLHAAMGFLDAGLHRNTGYKLGGWHDVQWYQLPLGEYALPPLPLIPFSKLETGAVLDVLQREADRVNR